MSEGTGGIGGTKDFAIALVRIEERQIGIARDVSEIKKYQKEQNGYIRQQEKFRARAEETIAGIKVQQAALRDRVCALEHDNDGAPHSQDQNELRKTLEAVWSWTWKIIVLISTLFFGIDSAISLLGG